MKTATARATEAIEAAQMMFADEMGATLDLSPAARMALIETTAAAIRTAIAEEAAESRAYRRGGAGLLDLLNHAIESSRLPPSPQSDAACHRGRPPTPNSAEPRRRLHASPHRELPPVGAAHLFEARGRRCFTKTRRFLNGRSRF